ncbi:sugar-binding protein [Paenibacillus naphthalenovorans]|uniref:LacI family transcriptional regulator n=1 Tax=Paenibacillus naphthalenovorans TaxID=162209 RepID=A0A0U2U9Z9_9BACL|nr:LacI family transcriptional regulator [Paenibacillus naphthalenovorans]NTZ17369.1 sugar ABC transporter substrate-binding protein [Paenibacillus sp. JMULE4]
MEIKVKQIWFLYFVLFAALLSGSFWLGISFYQSWELAKDARRHFTENANPVKQKQILLVSEEAKHPYWDVVLKGAQAAAGEDLRIDLQGPYRASIEEHRLLIERAIASKVDGIITQGLDDVFVPVINKAVEAGIPLITIDTDAPQSKRLAFVGTDNYRAGVQIGNYLKAHRHDPAHIGIISGNPEGQHMKLRIEGFKEAIKDRRDFTIVALEGSQISKLEAVKKAYEMLKEHPDINVMFGVSALDGPGIAQAVNKYFPARQIDIIAFDDLPETVELIKQGVIQAAVQQKSYLMGFKSVELMRRIIHRKPVSPMNYTESFIIDRSSMDAYLQTREE